MESVGWLEDEVMRYTLRQGIMGPNGHREASIGALMGKSGVMKCSTAYRSLSSAATLKWTTERQHNDSMGSASGVQGRPSVRGTTPVSDDW